MFNAIKELKSTTHEVIVKIDDDSIKAIRKVTLQTAATIVGIIVLGHVALVLEDRK